MKFTYEPGRHIHCNGKEYLSIRRVGNTPPVEADNMTRQIVELLNAFGTSSPTVCDYSNYETFHVAMFLNGNSSSSEVYELCRWLAKGALREETPALWLADKFREIIEERHLAIDRREERCKGSADILAHSLLTAALGRVNWRELAEEWIGHVFAVYPSKEETA